MQYYQNLKAEPVVGGRNIEKRGAGSNYPDDKGLPAAAFFVQCLLVLASLFGQFRYGPRCSDLLGTRRK